MTDRILIGSCVNQHKDYIVDRWIDHIDSLSHDSLDVYLIDNTRLDGYYDKLVDITKDRKNNYIIEKDVWCSDYLGRMMISHNKLREYALKHDYDYLIILDQDVFPPKDFIQRMISTKLPVLTGVYFLNLSQGTGNNTALWYNRKIFADKMLKVRWLEEEFLNKGIARWKGGYPTGCLMIRKDVLIDTVFRHNGKLQDSYFFADVKGNGYHAYVDTDLICDHYPSMWDVLIYQDKAERKNMNEV